MLVTGDPLTENILASLPRDVRKSLSELQIKSLRSALSKLHTGQQHIIDIRLSIPVFFQRYYLVFMFGKDKRSVIQRTLKQRRNEGNRILMVGIFIFVMSLSVIGLCTAVFALLYYTKTVLGINFSENYHLSDLLTL